MSSSQVFQLVVWWLWSCYFFTCDALDDLPTGFFQNIDGISLGITSSHLCSIESKPGVEMGGTAACWGFDVQDILFVPKNVIYPDAKYSPLM